MFKLLNLAKCLTVVIQFMNINSEIYREIALLQMYLIKVSEGTACVTWNKEYVSIGANDAFCIMKESLPCFDLILICDPALVSQPIYKF